MVYGKKEKKFGIINKIKAVSWSEIIAGSTSFPFAASFRAKGSRCNLGCDPIRARLVEITTTGPGVCTAKSAVERDRKEERLRDYNAGPLAIF